MKSNRFRDLSRLDPTVLVLFLLLIAAGLAAQALAGAIIRNVGMLSYARYHINRARTPADLLSAKVSLSRAVDTDPASAISRARLASVLTEIGDLDGARREAQEALELSGRSSDCYFDPLYSSTRVDVRPPHFRPAQLLPFSHPQSAWHFFGDNGYIGSISFEPRQREDADCVVHISVDFDATPNRYAILMQEVELRPHTIYRLSALTMSQGILRAWFGLHSQWPGTPVSSSTEWQPVVFEFHTGAEPLVDSAHIVIDEGHGTLAIRELTLQEITLNR